MSNAVLILGESGTGKSSSIRTLNPKETFVINILNKPLPFKGYAKNYSRISPDATTGNYYESLDYARIDTLIRKINQLRPDIKNLVIDDFQFLMGNEFMNRCMEKGYEKFSDIGRKAYQLLRSLSTLRDDLDVFILTHSDIGENGKMKAKTIGRMLDDKITFEALYTTVLQTEVKDGVYSFLTQGDQTHIAKSPMGMFEEKTVPNDLNYIKTKIHAYYEGDAA